jgi:hypothetical protein
MPTKRAAQAAQSLPGADEHRPLGDGEIIAFDDVALRRARLVAYVDQTRAVIVYRFVLPQGALVAGLGSGQPRNAADQLQLIVGLTGGAVARSHDGLAARIPKTLAARFETLAGPLIEAYLVSLDLGTPPGEAT